MLTQEGSLSLHFSPCAGKRTEDRSVCVCVMVKFENMQMHFAFPILIDADNKGKYKVSG